MQAQEWEQHGAWLKKNAPRAVRHAVRAAAKARRVANKRPDSAQAAAARVATSIELERALGAVEDALLLPELIQHPHVRRLLPADLVGNPLAQKPAPVV